MRVNGMDFHMSVPLLASSSRERRASSILSSSVSSYLPFALVPGPQEELNEYLLNGLSGPLLLINCRSPKS